MTGTELSRWSPEELNLIDDINHIPPSLMIVQTKFNISIQLQQLL